MKFVLVSFVPYLKTKPKNGDENRIEIPRSV